jgi:hypothetical protein
VSYAMFRVARVTDLAVLARTVTAFAAERALTLVPMAPTRDLGPEVSLSPAEVALPGFLELAAALGGGVLYLQATAFDPQDDPVDEPPAALLAREGQIGELTVAFAANGLTHFWQHRTDWYQQWLALALAPRTRQLFTAPEEPQLSPEDRERLAGELTSTLLADPVFRAAKPGGARQRYAKFALPADTHRWVVWDVVRDACDQADELARVQYEQIPDRLDDLAADLLATTEYRQASSPAARKQVAERFLTTHADGFAPPTHLRDELYARAQRQAKTRQRPAALI